MDTTESVLKTSLEVEVNKEKYEFKIPTIHEEIGVGIRVKDIRRRLEPTWNGFEAGLDGQALLELRACATFELLLLKSSSKWPWIEDAKGNVICNSSKFPNSKYNDVLLAYQNFQDALNSFRTGGNPD